jgi:quercetin dioxygenase-like cupin family protein
MLEQKVNHVEHLEPVMPVIPAPTEPTHEMGGNRFTSLATPSRGSSSTCVWRVHIAPGTPAAPHRLTAEEVFVVLSGTASVRIDDQRSTARAGDAISVPPDVVFEISAEGEDPLEALCVMPVGGQAALEGGDPFTPPWAQ